MFSIVAPHCSGISLSKSTVSIPKTQKGLAIKTVTSTDSLPIPGREADAQQVVGGEEGMQEQEQKMFAYYSLLLSQILKE